MGLALLILRLAVGVLLAGHGAQKLLGWFGGSGIRGTAAWLDSLGLRPALFWAVLAGLMESAGGLLFALGLFCPLGSLFIGASMLTAISKVHWPKLWAADGGVELPLKNLLVVLAVGLTGPGRLSLDGVFGTSLSPAASMLGLAIVVLGWYLALISSTLAAASTSADKDNNGDDAQTASIAAQADVEKRQLEVEKARAAVPIRRSNLPAD